MSATARVEARASAGAAANRAAEAAAQSTALLAERRAARSGWDRLVISRPDSRQQRAFNGAAFGNAGRGLNYDGVKTLNYAQDRGWSDIRMNWVVANPTATRGAYNRVSEASASVYYRADGHNVVVDVPSRRLAQVSNLNQNYWRPDRSVANPYIGAGFRFPKPPPKRR
jgi:hypothetical protein